MIHLASHLALGAQPEKSTNSRIRVSSSASNPSVNGSRPQQNTKILLAALPLVNGGSSE